MGTLSTSSSEGLHENKSRLYFVVESAINSSSVGNGEGTGMYTAAIGFIGSHSESLWAIAPAYRCSSTVPKMNHVKCNIFLWSESNKTDHSQSLPPLKLRETLSFLREQNNYFDRFTDVVVLYAKPTHGYPGIDL